MNLIYDIIDISIWLINSNLNGEVFEKNKYELALNSPIPFSHYQRIMLAVILELLYNNKMETKIYNIAKNLLSRKDYNNAKIIGTILRICYEIDGPVFTQPSFNIVMTDRGWQLRIERSIPKVVFLSAYRLPPKI
jgi:3-methyladenine DNA glycosylase AlkD